jgi:ribonucleoside-diphosphate reductase alpha chain
MVGNVVAAPVGRRHHYDVGVGEIAERSEARVRSTRLLRLAQEHGLCVGDKHKVPESVFTGCQAMQRGFLQALFTADGHVSGTLEKGHSVRLTSINRQLLVDVQRLLLNFGIASRIYTDRRGEGLRLLPDGHGGTRPYECRAYHDLVVGKDNLARFASEIGFLTQAKQQALLSRLAAYQQGPYRERFTARFAALEPEGEEAVYDLTEPVTHSFVANGLVVHNCGEQPLYPNEACNLGSLNLARFVRAGGLSLQRHGRGLAGVEALDWERMERAVRVAIRFLDDVITVNPYPDAHIDRAVKANRRVGLGVMGWADLLIDLEIPYDSEDALRLGTEMMRRINEWAHDESCRLAEERGPFPNWAKSIYQDGRPQRNATTTTIAPTGTISIIRLLVGHRAAIRAGVRPPRLPRRPA